MLTDIEIQEIPATKVAAIEIRTTFDQIGPSVGEAFRQLYGHLAASGVEPVGPPTTVYWEADPQRGVTATVCVPVRGEAPATGGIAMRVLPEATVAVALHRGPYEDLPAAYEAVERYLFDRGFVTGGPMREQYLNGPPDAAPDGYETRILWPVATGRELSQAMERS